MIIVATPLSDWGETSADQTIALTEYLLQAFNIDPGRAYLIAKTYQELNTPDQQALKKE